MGDIRFLDFTEARSSLVYESKKTKFFLRKIPLSLFGPCTVITQISSRFSKLLRCSFSLQPTVKMSPRWHVILVRSLSMFFHSLWNIEGVQAVPMAEHLTRYSLMFMLSVRIGGTHLPLPPVVVDKVHLMILCSLLTGPSLYHWDG